MQCICEDYADILDLPDLTDEANVERLLQWDGSNGGVAQIKMISLTEKPVEKKTDTEMKE